MNAIQELVKEIKNLKPIPAVINQILEVVDQPDSSMSRIADIIQYDPAITASVLRTCNSVFFGLKNPAESIKDAVSLLGIDQIIEIVLMKSTDCTKAFIEKYQYYFYSRTAQGHWQNSSGQVCHGFF